MCAKLLCFNRVSLFATPGTVAHQAPLAMGFPRQEYWNALLFPPPEDFPDPGIKPPTLTSPALAGGFFTTTATWEAPFTKHPGETNANPFSCNGNYTHCQLHRNCAPKISSVRQRWGGSMCEHWEVRGHRRLKIMVPSSASCARGLRRHFLPQTFLLVTK